MKCENTKCDKEAEVEIRLLGCVGYVCVEHSNLEAYKDWRKRPLNQKQSFWSKIFDSF